MEKSLPRRVMVQHTAFRSQEVGHVVAYMRRSEENQGSLHTCLLRSPSLNSQLVAIHRWIAERVPHCRNASVPWVEVGRYPVLPCNAPRTLQRTMTRVIDSLFNVHSSTKTDQDRGCFT